jgi:AcrR family transcriptional regulator
MRYFLDGDVPLQSKESCVTPRKRVGAPVAVAPRKRARRSDGETTRTRVLEAAVSCILDVGYYQASSNAIARQAGVTWGTIQHQFGTREGLMLEIIEDGFASLDRHLATAEVDGTDLEERLASVLELFEVYYGRPEHLVHIQILLDLSADPFTSDPTRQALDKQARALTRAWKPFFVQAMGDASQNAELVEYAFLTLRGYLTANLLTSRLRPVGRKSSVRQLLVRGVACAIAERADELGLSVDPESTA